MSYCTSYLFSWYFREAVLNRPSAYNKRLTLSWYLPFEKYRQPTKKHLIALLKNSNTSSFLNKERSGFILSTSIIYFNAEYKSIFTELIIITIFHYFLRSRKFIFYSFFRWKILKVIQTFFLDEFQYDLFNVGIISIQNS